MHSWRFFCRALVAPFAWKGDRDQRILRSLRAKTAALKTPLANDPVRLSRALRDQMREYWLKPGRNALALLFISAFALGIEVAITLGQRQPAGAGKPPIDLAALATLGLQIETLFGQPQDIEWAHDGSQFWILQSRDIVAAAQAVSPLLQEWQRLCVIAQSQAVAEPSAPGAAMFTMDDMSELLPAPTPVSLALLEAVCASGGSLDLAARSLGGRTAFAGHNVPKPQPISTLRRLGFCAPISGFEQHAP